ncbi:MAG: LysR family transcriptional regulator [Pseudomonadota bacterium]
MRINFDFSDLEAFLAVYDTGSFHLASEKLGLSQSSVTRRIQKLEMALDSTLFQRTTRAVKPTLTAKRLKLRAEAILSDTRETARAMRDESSAYAHQRARSLTIATLPTVLSQLLAPVARAMLAEHAGLRLRLLDLTANDVAEAVAEGDADIGICSVPALEPNTDFEPLFNDPIVIAMAQDHPFTRRPGLRWSDLSSEPLILPQRGTGNRMAIDEALAKAGQPLVWTVEVGRTSTALNLAAIGVGIAPVPQAALSDTTGLAMRPIIDPLVSRPIGLLTRTGQKQSGLVDQFSNAIRQHVVADQTVHA